MKPTFPLLCTALLPLAALHAAPKTAIKAAPHTTTAKPAPATPAISQPAISPFARPLSGEKLYSHLLNRLAFGPRPGDIENLEKTGVSAWIEAQMAPQKLDDSSLDAQLAGFRWLSASPEQLTLIYQSDNAGFLRRLKKSQNGAAPGVADAKNGAPTGETMQPNGAMAMQDPALVAPAAKSRFNQPLTAQQKATMARIEAANLPPRASIEALGQLTVDKLARAVSSKRQLQEVLVDFWGNHFNVDVKKAQVRTLKIRDDRDVIRAHVFGTFRELLGASAHSPAMLVYLDNARSTREFPVRATKRAQGQKRGGLNENYGRELMELHTLGVDGGYTQTDVTEVARCFTGWSLDPESGKFVFRARAHDNGAKVVLGQTIAAGGGPSDGERVLDILAQSPATANFIARQLCLRFVCDTPPDALVTRIAGVFTRTNGDLSAVYRALFAAPEFLSEGAYRAKIKSPLEYTVSAVRALGGTLDVDAQGADFRLLATGGASLSQGNNGNRNRALKRVVKKPLGVEIANMGQPLFSCQPPTGYPEDSRKWVSASALVSRLNFALALTGGNIGDVSLTKDTFRAAPLDEMAQNLLGAPMTPATRDLIAGEAQKSPGDGARLRALVLGSPEFQRR